jgi:aryl-alcohol dehydrogenase-like predicted oxidoreductase
MLDRHIEDELIPYVRHCRVAITVFAATAIGLLSGRFRYGQPPPADSSWARGPYNYRVAMTKPVDRVIQAVMEIAQERGRTPSQVAMAWCLTRPEITAVVTGADTPDRVDENFGAVGWHLSDEERDRLDSLSKGMRMEVRKDCPEGYKPQAGEWEEENETE